MKENENKKTRLKEKSVSKTVNGEDEKITGTSVIKKLYYTGNKSCWATSLEEAKKILSKK